MESALAKLDPARPPLRWLLRSPAFFYRVGLGALLGRRFVQLTVRGRKTGLPRDVVLEVVGRDAATGGLLIASAWGRRAQWFRNLEAHPRAEVRWGGRRFAGSVAVLDDAAAAEAFRAYTRDHRWAYRWFIGPLLLGRRPRATPEELAELARAVPILRVREAEASAHS